MNAPRRSFVGRGAWPVGLGLAIALTALFVYWNSIHQPVRREADELQLEASRLRELVASLESAERQERKHQRVVLGAMSHCRQADDIPELGGRHVVSYHHQGVDSLCLHVPDGSYLLEISITWAPPDALSIEGESNRQLGTDRRMWKAPLMPAGGYWLAWEAGADSIGWELTSNHPEFKAQRGELSFDGPFRSAASWSMPCSFIHWTDKRPKPAGEWPLMTRHVEGRLAEQECTMKLEVVLRRDGRT